jgi:hypothetical protein
MSGYHEIVDPVHNTLIRILEIVEPTVCMYCKGPVTTFAYAIGDPYLGVLHKDCAPLFPFSNEWAHPLPLFLYRNQK